MATSFSRVKNVDSVSEPKFKKKHTKIVNFLNRYIFGFSSTLKLFSTVPVCYVRRCFIQQECLSIEKLYVPADLTSHIQPEGLCSGSGYLEPMTNLVQPLDFVVFVERPRGHPEIYW